MNQKTAVAAGIATLLFLLIFVLAFQNYQLNKAITVLGNQQADLVNKTTYNQLVGAVNTNATVCINLATVVRGIKENQSSLVLQTIPNIEFQLDQMTALTNLYVKFDEFEQRQNALKQDLSQKNEILGKEALKLEALETAVIKVTMAIQAMTTPAVKEANPQIQVPQVPPDEATPTPGQFPPDPNAFTAPPTQFQPNTQSK